MALDASSLLGTPQIVGFQVSPVGTYDQTISHMRGGQTQVQLGSLLWRFALRKKLREEQALAGQSAAPPIGNRAFMALTADELALVSVETKRRVQLAGVISRLPRSEVASNELSKRFPGASLPLTITLTNGQRWLFEVPWLTRGRARRLVRELGV